MQGTVQKRPIFKIQYAVILSLLVLVASFIGCVAIKDAHTKVIFSDVFSPVINSFATLGLFLAARHSASISKRLGTAWYLIAFAQLAYTIGDVSWTVIELGLKQSPFPSFSDAWYIAYYPLFMAGTFFLTTRQHSRLEWSKRLLDTGIIMIAALLGFWNFLLGPLAAAGGTQPPLTQILTLAYPVGDLVLVSAVLWLLNSNSSKQFRLPITLLVCSSIVMIVTDCLFSYQSMMGTYEAGGIIDFGWFITYTLAGMAGFFQANTIKFSNEQQRRELPIPDPNNKWQNLLTYLPYFWLLFAYLLLMYSNKTSTSLNFSQLYFGVGLILALVVIRQLVALEENKSLFNRLQRVLSHVQKQSIVLEQTNSELETEIIVRKEIEERLSYDALHDSLTDLPNRTLFNDRLERAIEDSKLHPEHIYSVLFMDIDQFKVINDSLGHALGDRLLMILAQRLKDCLRGKDTAARLGGDEFVILLENTSKEETISFVVNRIQEEAQKVIDLEGHSVFITTSIGVVFDVSRYEIPVDVLRDADIAMYRAKAHGKDRYEIFYDGMRIQAYSRMEIEEDLRSALDNAEFELYFQPIINLENDELIGFESLIRWNHPQYGLLHPNDFISIAEESGLILQIGQWVLLETCSQLKKWHEVYPRFNHLTIQANISGKQFSQPLFTEQVQFALNQAGLEAKYLKLEITESVLIDSYSNTADKFLKLNEIGVQLEVDDFGTGHSSLSYIQNFPIHTIKIDQSFVHDIGKKKKASELIHTIISMAHDLGMEMIAEGIETEEQLAELKILACHYGQGFFISKPLNGQLVNALLDGLNPLFAETMAAERQ